MSNDQALLIGDETALPTAVSLLRHWQNDQPPYANAITLAREDEHYLNAITLPAGTIVHRIRDTSNILEKNIQRYRPYQASK